MAPAADDDPGSMHNVQTAIIAARAHPLVAPTAGMSLSPATGSETGHAIA
jgi:hypothetical protein